MNHDNAHCFDYGPDCPQRCFRAKLTHELKSRSEYLGLPVSWMHFKGTKECLVKRAHTKMRTSTKLWREENNMSMSYKDDCERCIEYLCGQRAGLEGFAEGEHYEHFKEWQKKPDEDKWESLVEYTKAVRAALEMISYYETCSAIIKAKEGPEYVENIGREYYKMMTAPIGERFGIGFGKGDDVIEDD